MKNNEFELYYQPQLDINTHKITGFEALIRWKNSQLGFVTPLKFISIAEDTNLIIPIGAWVLRTACLFLKTLHLYNYTDLNISVNVSIIQLLQDNFVDIVLEILDSTKLNPGQLELEITESILMESYEAIEEIGENMNLCVIAEGVETQEQMDYLVECNCNKIQGYLFSKPIPEHEAFKKIQNQG